MLSTEMLKRSGLARLAIVMSVASVLLAGCAATDGGSSYGDYPRFTVGDETVYVVPAEAATTSFPDVRTLVSKVPVIFVGTVVSATDGAVEAQPKDGDEGVFPGEGSDIYGSITFKVTSVVKGEIGRDEITIGYESGKRDAHNPKVRLSYRYEGLAPFQKSDGSLRSAAELAGRTFVVFAMPNRGSVPTQVAGYVQALWSGIAELDQSTLVFRDGSPVSKDRQPVVIHLQDLLASAG